MSGDRADIGVVTVRDGDYHPNRRLGEAAFERGVGFRLINPYRIHAGIENGRVYLSDPEHDGLPGVIVPRQGAQIGRASMTVLKHFQVMGIPMASKPDSILVASNKFLTMQRLAVNKIAVPDSFFVNSPETYLAGIERLGGFPVVAKKLSGRQGKEVFLVHDRKSSDLVLSDHLEPAQGLLLQEFIPPRGRKDLRVIVIGGKVAGAMEMRPPEGDFRSNFHITSSSTGVNLFAGLQEMAIAGARAVGLETAGIDVIIDRNGQAYIIEVNYSPGFRGMEEATGIDIAGRIIEHAVSLVRKAGKS